MPGKGPPREWVEGPNPSSANVWFLHLLQPGSSQGTSFSSRRVSQHEASPVSQKRTVCFLISTAFQFSGRCGLDFCSLASLAAVSHCLTFCIQFCFGEWGKFVYLAVRAIRVVTAKQRNYVSSQQGEGTVDYAVLDKYQLSENVLLTPRPGSFLPSLQSKMLKYFKKGTFWGFFYVYHHCNQLSAGKKEQVTELYCLSVDILSVHST